jgi:hypothetical protein
MNRSQSKIRHMQQANILLEQRRLSLIKEDDNLSPLNSPYSGKFPSINVLNKFRGVKYEVVSKDPSTPTRNFKINDVSEGDKPYLVDIDVTEIGADGGDIDGDDTTVQFNCNNKSMTVKPSYFNQNPEQINVSAKWVSDKMWDLYCKPAKK